MRRAVGAGVGLWFLEVTAGTLGFLWSAAAQATAKVRIGTFDELLLANGDLPIADGFPAYVARRPGVRDHRRSGSAGLEPGSRRDR